MDNKQSNPSQSYLEVVLNGQLLFKLAKQKIQTYPHSSIGVISARDKLDLPIFGSGARVSPNLVMTVAHNIFNRKQGVFFLQKGFQATKEYGSSYKNIRFHPAAYEQFKEEQGYAVQSWRYPTQYSQLLCKNWQFYDYALLKLVDSIPKPIGGFLRPVSYCHSCILDVNSKDNLLIYGYPFDKSLMNYEPLDQQGTHFRIFQYGLKRLKRVRKINKINMIVYYEMSTLPGQSGAPIVLGTYYIGIHARGNSQQKLNGGRLFTQQMIEVMDNWARQLKGDPFEEDQCPCQHQDHQKTKQKILKILLLKGNQSLKQQKYEQTLGHYSKILEIDPNNCEAVKGKGKCFHQKKNYTAAVEEYTTAIGIDHKDPSAYAERAFAYYCIKEYENCRKDCEEALKIDPNSSDAYLYKGYMNWDQRRYKQALSDCNMAIKLNDRNERAFNVRGNTYYNLEDYHKTLADYTTAIEIDPKYTNAQYNRGLTYDDLKDYHKALADYTTAIEIDPKSTDVYFNRGVTYKNLKDYKNALSDFQSALSLSPHDPLYLIQIAVCCDELGEAKLLAESLLKCEQSLSSKSPSQIQADFGISEPNMDFIRSNLSRLKAKVTLRFSI